jgi:hypothetical protein
MSQVVFDLLPDHSILQRIIWTKDTFYFFDKKWKQTGESNISTDIKDFYLQQIDDLLLGCFRIIGDSQGNSVVKIVSEYRQRVIDLYNLQKKLHRVTFCHNLCYEIKVRCYRKEIVFNPVKTLVPTSDDRLVMPNGMTRPALISDYILETLKVRYNPQAEPSQKIESLFQGYRDEILSFLNRGMIKREPSVLQLIEGPGNTGITTLIRTIENLFGIFMIKLGVIMPGIPSDESHKLIFKESTIVTRKSPREYNDPTWIVKLRRIENPVRGFFNSLKDKDYEYFLKIIIEHGLKRHNPTSLCALLVLYTDGYLKLRKRVSPEVKQWISIVGRLPLDPLQVYSNRHFKSSRDVISGNEFETDCKLVLQTF